MLFAHHPPTSAICLLSWFASLPDSDTRGVILFTTVVAYLPAQRVITYLSCPFLLCNMTSLHHPLPLVSSNRRQTLTRPLTHSGPVAPVSLHQLSLPNTLPQPLHIFPKQALQAESSLVSNNDRDQTETSLDDNHSLTTTMSGSRSSFSYSSSDSDRQHGSRREHASRKEPRATPRPKAVVVHHNTPTKDPKRTKEMTANRWT